MAKEVSFEELEKVSGGKTNVVYYYEIEYSINGVTQPTYKSIAYTTQSSAKAAKNLKVKEFEGKGYVVTSSVVLQA